MCLYVSACGCLHCLNVHVCPVCAWVMTGGRGSWSFDWVRRGEAGEPSPLCSGNHQTLFLPILNNTWSLKIHVSKDTGTTPENKKCCLPGMMSGKYGKATRLKTPHKVRFGAKNNKFVEVWSHKPQTCSKKTMFFVFGLSACYIFLLLILFTVLTCTHSAPLKNRVVFTLSAPIRTPLNIFISACRTIPQGQSANNRLHQETRKARDSEVLLHLLLELLPFL